MRGCALSGPAPDTVKTPAETAALPIAFIALLLTRIAPARPVFWIAPCSDLHPPGLLSYGFDPNRLVLVRPGTAIAVPTRGADALALSFMVPVDPSQIVRVHAILMDIPFMNHE